MAANDAFYEELRQIADELITEFGMGASLRRKIAGGGTATRACTIVNIDYKDDERDGQIILANDRRWLIAGGAGGVLALAPDKEEDKLVLGAKEQRIVDVHPIQPATIAVVWIAQTRQG